MKIDSSFHKGEGAVIKGEFSYEESTLTLRPSPTHTLTLGYNHVYAF